MVLLLKQAVTVCGGVLCSTLQYSAVLCSTLQYSAVLQEPSSWFCSWGDRIWFLSVLLPSQRGVDTRTQSPVCTALCGEEGQSARSLRAFVSADTSKLRSGGTRQLPTQQAGNPGFISRRAPVEDSEGTVLKSDLTFVFLCVKQQRGERRRERGVTVRERKKSGAPDA
ncbi:hypothetical protein D5F01_LYC14429 [Larimichthys crocea]|uniref:Uncharacterized protein n=1 Tax=Larimichthys crocea TaxID=215358 RepID=A0A6G0I4Y8_LARCR|nr:hypothetical protein D5F01_LYC14429 [Larimichthys crocea]